MNTEFFRDIADSYPIQGIIDVSFVQEVFKEIYPIITNAQEIDYKETIKFLCDRLNTSENVAEHILKMLLPILCVFQNKKLINFCTCEINKTFTLERNDHKIIMILLIRFIWEKRFGN